MFTYWVRKNDVNGKEMKKSIVKSMKIANGTKIIDIYFDDVRVQKSIVGHCKLSNNRALWISCPPNVFFIIYLFVSICAIVFLLLLYTQHGISTIFSHAILVLKIKFIDKLALFNPFSIEIHQHRPITVLNSYKA